MSNFSCSSGVYDCQYAGIPADEVSSCANYNEKFDDMEGKVWIVILSGIIMCLMSFGIGSNDAANSWATAVGSGAIKIRTALIVGGVFEFLGTVLLGSSVADTIKQDIADIESQSCWACGFCNSKIPLFQMGMLSTLISTAVFLLLSSFTSMPVSATHAVVGGVAGMTMGAVGAECVDWSFNGMGALVASWVISPIFAGVVASFVYIITKWSIMESPHPRDKAVLNVPIFITFTTFILSFLICIKSQDLKDFDIAVHCIISLGMGALAFCISSFFVLPWIKQNLPTTMGKRNGTRFIANTTGDVQMTESSLSENDESEMDSIDLLTVSGSKSDDVVGARSDDFSGDEISIKNETRDALFCFKTLLVFIAALKSFAHGANDTANATGPFGAVLEVYGQGLDVCNTSRASPLWVLVLAGACVALGIYSLGHKVIKTIGENLTTIDYHSGFCIELGSCVTVVLATLLGIPVSTTHCQIGAVVGTGLLTTGKDNISWQVINRIVFTWILTVPISGLLSVTFTEIFQSAILV